IDGEVDGLFHLDAETGGGRGERPANADLDLLAGELRGSGDRAHQSENRHEQGESAATTGHGNLQMTFCRSQAVTHLATSQQSIDGYGFPLRRRAKMPEKK